MNAFIGDTGSGSLKITDGGSVSNRAGFIGHRTGSLGQVSVVGTNSTWKNSGGLFIGESGSGSLEIVDGGQVTVEKYTWLSHYSGSSGTIHFDNGKLVTGDLLCAVDDLTGTGTISTHGLISDVDLVFDATNGLSQTLNINESPGQNITINLTVDGSGSMGAGYGDSGTVNISDGIIIESTFGYIGYGSGSTGKVTVNGNGSTWRATSTSATTITIGHFGSGMLNITAGGTVTSDNIEIGCESGSTGLVTVDGAGSNLTSNNYHIYVGRNGNGTLNITGGGAVSNRSGFIGFRPSSVSQVTVNGAGSTWTNDDNLHVGFMGSGILTITDSGVVRCKNGYIGYFNDLKCEVTVNGIGSKWTNDNELVVGGAYYASQAGSGMLNIISGGEVSSHSGYIGFEPNSTGEVMVDGVGSTWTNSSNLYVGRSGSGILNIRGGGLVSITGTLTIDNDADGDGFINITSGGMLALYGNADESLSDFTDLINGTDAIRYWDDSISDWADINDATCGRDYTLSYQTKGDLEGYTLLTVCVPEPSMLTGLLGLCLTGLLGSVRHKR